MVQKHIYQKDINDILESLLILLLNDNHTDSQVKILIEYNDRENSECEYVIGRVGASSTKTEGRLMTIAEQLIQQSKQKGRQDALKEMALNLLQSRVDKATIIKAMDLALVN